MSEIPFIQYLRPDGRKRIGGFERPDKIVNLAQKIIDRGFRFECEHLVTGEISLTISNDEADHAIEIVSNGPEVLDAIDRLIINFTGK